MSLTPTASQIPPPLPPPLLLSALTIYIFSSYNWFWIYCNCILQPTKVVSNSSCLYHQQRWCPFFLCCLIRFIVGRLSTLRDVRGGFCNRLGIRTLVETTGMFLRGVLQSIPGGTGNWHCISPALYSISTHTLPVLPP